MTVIRQEDFILSVAGALQYISYYHPVDYITSLAKAYEKLTESEVDALIQQSAWKEICHGIKA